MTAVARKIRVRQPECIELAEALCSQRDKFVEQFSERSAPRPAKHRLAFECRKRDRGAVLKDVFDPRSPVCAFAVNQMTHDIERAPRVGPFVAAGPFSWEIPQQRTQNGRCSLEHRPRLAKLKLYVLTLDRDALNFKPRAEEQRARADERARRELLGEVAAIDRIERGVVGRV